MSDEYTREPAPRAEPTYEIPLNATLAHCRGCGAGIYWVRTPAGANMPVDPGTGVSHFSTCPQAARFSRKREVPRNPTGSDR
jgi:hypothetical protein